MGILGSPAAGLGLNFVNGLINNNRFDEFVETQLNPLNDEIRGSLGGVNQIADQGTRFGNTFFNDEAARTRFDSAFGGISQGFGAAAAQGRHGQDTVNRFSSNQVNQFGQRAQDIRGQFDQQTARARGLVDQFGAQEARDINQRFDAQGARAAADLSARGIGGSTVRQSQEQMNERGRTDAHGRLQDRLTSQRLGVEQNFGNAGINFSAGASQNLAGLGMQAAGMRQAGNQFNTNAQFNALGAQAGIAGQQLDNRNFAAQSRLGNMLDFEDFRFGSHNAALGQVNLVSPTTGDNVRIQPSVRG